jgi:hypothetical protein
MVTPDGIDVGFHGSSDRHQSTVVSRDLRGVPGMECCRSRRRPAAVNTATLTEKAGRTTATMLSEYPSQEIRDTVSDGDGGRNAGRDGPAR